MKDIAGLVWYFIRAVLGDLWGKRMSTPLILCFYGWILFKQREASSGHPMGVNCKVERESLWNTVSTSSPVTYLPVHLPSLGGVLKSGLLPLEYQEVSVCIGRRVWSSPTLCSVKCFLHAAAILLQVSPAPDSSQTTLYPT